MNKVKKARKSLMFFFISLLMVVITVGSPMTVSAAINPGTKSSAVKTMQKKLLALGYLSCAADGSYGSKTKAAVKSFESKNGLKADGIADNTMLSTLDTVYNNAARIKITSSSVNARSGAGTKYKKVATVKKNSTYIVLGTKKVSSKTWYKFKYNTKTAWVCGSYVKYTAAKTASTTTSTESANTTSVQIVIDTADKSGSDISVSTTAAAKTTTAATTAATTAQTGNRSGRVSVSSSLTVRKGAGTSYDKIGSLDDGDTVTIIDQNTAGDWYKIKYGSTTGWVCAKYIDIISVNDPNTKIDFSQSYYYIGIGEKLNFNFGSGVKYSVKDAKKVSVSEKGEVVGLAAGMTTLTAKNGSSSDTAEIVVLRDPYTLTDEQKNMGISSKGVTFIANWEGGGSTDPKIDNGNTLIFRPYKDASGYWTIGYGHAKTSSASKSWSEATAIAAFAADIQELVGDSIVLDKDKPYLTKDEAKTLLLADLNNGVYVAAIRKWAVRNGVKLEQNQFDALVSFVYNLGTSYFSNDSNHFYLKSAIISHRCGNDADAAQVTEGFSRYIKSGSKYLKGLYYRRMNEAEMFTDANYTIERSPKFTPPSNISWS